MSRLGSFAVAALALAVLATGCGSHSSSATTQKIDAGKVSRSMENGIVAKLHAGLTVTCPKNVERTQGVAFTCTAKSANSKAIPVRATETDGKGNVNWSIKARSTTAIELNIANGILKQKKISSRVLCPDAVELKAGSTFDCTAKQQLTGTMTRVHVTMTDNEGSVDWKT